MLESGNSRIRHLQTAVCLALIVLLFASCSREEEVTPTATPPGVSSSDVVEESTVTPSPSPAPEPSATVPPAAPSATAEPSPIPYTVSAADQPLGEDGEITIQGVTAPEPLWLVIHAQHNGQVGEVLGYTLVEAGLNSDISVTVDPSKASTTLVAMLHLDVEELGDFEFPGPDAPLQVQSETVASSFEVEFAFALPSITVSDQDVDETGLIQVESVRATRPGWLFIHADQSGTIGPALGFVYLKEGDNEDLSIPIPWREASPKLHAMLYLDVGEPHRYDPQLDLPALANGEPVVASFNVTYPPDVFVFDQPVVDGQVVVERVVSNGPGWLVIYFNDNGNTGRIVGFASLVDGVNEQIAVPVVESAVTPILYVLLHEDTEPGDDFRFPAADRPITYNGRRPAPFTIVTNAGNYVITRDQPPVVGDDAGAASVTIPFVVIDTPTWLVVQADAEGEAGEVIGFDRLPAGINRDVSIEIDPELATSTLYATLHRDAGVEGEFEYPDGPDIPLQRGRDIIRSPFMLLSELEE